jgi:hypothetical protein
MVTARTGGAFFLALTCGCKPSLDDTVSIVATPSVLAVRSELLVQSDGGATPPPWGTEAEATPAEGVKLTALYVTGTGPVVLSSLQWAFCDERKPLAELAPVNPLCLDLSGPWFSAIGVGNEVTGAMPGDACQQFGPDVPQPQAGQPPGRPVDPDSTGGYYQPIRLLGPGSSGPMVTVAGTRIRCTLASYSQDTVAAYNQRYHRNTNPSIASLGIKGAPAPWSPSSDANATLNSVTAGQHVAIEVSWATCPTTDVAGDGVCGPDETGTTCSTCGSGVNVAPPDCCVDVSCVHAKGCTGAERYVLLDPMSGNLVDRREAMAVAWFATGGAFDVDRSGRSNDDLETTSDNGWSAPDTPGTVVMWVVLRDERGGVGWQQYAIDVR